MIDHEDEVRAQGQIRASSGATTLRVSPSPGVGYYTLVLQYENGGVYERVFCILPHPDDARGDGGLFGIGGAPTWDWFWDAAWQMGARHCRAEFAWTEVERQEGQYRLDWVREVAAKAQERDMQLTVLTGHTPRHYSVRPIDAEGRVASAWFTWQPERTIEWYNFIDAMARTLVPERLQAEPGHPADTIARSGVPLVRAWEIWSEADQNFYYGSWNRYMDMLRIAYCTLKRQGRVPVVYGSCGHMTEMKYTIVSGCADHLDRVAFHPYHTDPQWMMMHWYRNMPQALIEAGLMRDTALTECGFHPPEGGATEAGFMSRTYATLMAYGEDLFIRAQCLGAVFPSTLRPNALAVRVDGELVPQPAYVAFAVTRWLLESAHYVGPLEAPEGARMELFIRQGVPVVVGWTDEGTHPVQLQMQAGGYMMDALGKRTPLAGPTAGVQLSPNAIAVLGVSYEEFAAAAAAGIDLVLTTELGHESTVNSRGLDTLEEDIATCAGVDGAKRLRGAVDDACEQLLAFAPQGPAAFYEVQRITGELMLRMAHDAREGEQGLQRLHRNTIWRLAQLAERMGDIADGLGAGWPWMNNVSSDDMQKIVSDINRTRARMNEVAQGGEYPFADRLLDRALSRLDEVRRGGGHSRGAWWAATVNARAAHSLTAVEAPVMRRVFVTANFTSSDIITKGVLLRPRSGHKLEARVYNFLSEGISGRIEAALPEGWGTGASSRRFTAPAGGASELIEMPFAVPDQPTPWVQRALGRFEYYDLKVDAPATAQLRETLQLSGEMTFGAIEPMTYRVFVGAYPSAAPSKEEQEMHSYAVKPRLHDGTIWATGR